MEAAVLRLGARTSYGQDAPRCSSSIGFRSVMLVVSHRNRFETFVLGSSKVLGKTILEFLNTDRAHKMTLRCSYGGYFRSEVKLWQAAEKA